MKGLKANRGQISRTDVTRADMKDGRHEGFLGETSSLPKHFAAQGIGFLRGEGRPSCLPSFMSDFDLTDLAFAAADLHGLQPLHGLLNTPSRTRPSRSPRRCT